MSDFSNPPLPKAVSPYLHATSGRFYNPLTDAALAVGEPLFAALRSLREDGSAAPADLAALDAGGWLIADAQRTSQSFLLKYVSLETVPRSDRSSLVGSWRETRSARISSRRSLHFSRTLTMLRRVHAERRLSTQAGRRSLRRRNQL